MSYSFAPITFGIVLIILLAFVNALSSRIASKTDAAMVAIKLAALAVFAAFALFFAFGTGHFAPSNFSVTAAQAGIGGILAACIAIMFAYSGFQTIATIASNVKGGSDAGGKAIVLAVGISLGVYLIIATSMILLVPSSSYKIGADPLAFALQSSNAPAWITGVVDVGAMLATASATLAMIMASSRMAYQISIDGLLPPLFQKYNRKRDVAINSIAVSALIGIVTLFAGNIFVIAAISTFGILFYYIMTGLAVIHFRRKGPIMGFKVPMYPYSVIVSIVFLMMLMYGIPAEALDIGITMILGLLVIYYIGREVDNKKPVQIRIFK